MQDKFGRELLVGSLVTVFGNSFNGAVLEIAERENDRSVAHVQYHMMSGIKYGEFFSQELIMVQ